MVHFEPGSLAYKMVTLFSVAGEFPTKSLSLIGYEHALKKVILNLTKSHEIRSSQTEITCRVLSVSDKEQNRSIRLYKGALPILKWIGAEEYYMRSF